MPSESGVTSSSSLIVDVARKDAGLHGRAERDHFIGIQIGVRLRPEERLDRRAHQRDARGSAHHHHFIDLLRREPASSMQSRQRPQRAVDDGRDQTLEKLAADLALVLLPRYSRSIVVSRTNESSSLA